MVREPCAPSAPSRRLALPAPSLRPACLPIFPFGPPQGELRAPCVYCMLLGNLGVPRHVTPCFPPCFDCVSELGGDIKGTKLQPRTGCFISGFVWASGNFLGCGWERVRSRGAWLGAAAALGGARRRRGSRGSRGSGRLAAPSGSQSASAAARGAARGGRSHIWRRRRPPTSPSDSAAPGGFEFWLPGKGPFLGERGLSFVRLRPLRAPLQAPPRPACARDCAAALTAPFICLWSRRAAPEAGDPAVSCSRGRRPARMTPR